MLKALNTFLPLDPVPWGSLAGMLCGQQLAGAGVPSSPNCPFALLLRCPTTTSPSECYSSQANKSIWDEWSFPFPPSPPPLPQVSIALATLLSDHDQLHLGKLPKFAGPNQVDPLSYLAPGQTLKPLPTGPGKPRAT